MKNRKNRFDIYSEIQDSMIRSELFEEIQKGNPNWDTWTVAPEEIWSSPLISQRFYGLNTLDWVIEVIVDGDPRDPIPAGITLSLPPLSWIRERIIHWQQFAKTG